MHCERSRLRDWSKMWKMFYIGNNLKRCYEIETAVMNSDYAYSSKRKWRRNIDTWLARRWNEAV